jgi:hypothetical protein
MRTILALRYLLVLCLPACGASIEVGSSDGVPPNAEQEAGDANGRSDSDIIYNPGDASDVPANDAGEAHQPPVGGGKPDAGVSARDADFE